jgi:hypothetical protein
VLVSFACILLAGVVQQPASARSAAYDVRALSSRIAPAEVAVIGTIERFEEAERRLVLKTHEGRVTFVLAATAVVRMGSRVLPAADLASHRGRRAKVRYTTADGRHTAHWVVISSEPPRPAKPLP